MRAFPLSHFVGIPTKRQRTAEAAPSAQPPKPRTANKPPAVRAKPLDGKTFAHLRPAIAFNAVADVPNASALRPAMATAEAILAAGRKRRGEIAADPPPLGTFERRVIDAGRRRRGEII